VAPARQSDPRTRTLHRFWQIQGVPQVTQQRRFEAQVTFPDPTDIQTGDKVLGIELAALTQATIPLRVLYYSKTTDTRPQPTDHSPQTTVPNPIVLSSARPDPGYRLPRQEASQSPLRRLHPTTGSPCPRRSTSDNRRDRRDRSDRSDIVQIRQWPALWSSDEARLAWRLVEAAGSAQPKAEEAHD
jgi:hypothetical protein